MQRLGGLPRTAFIPKSSPLKGNSVDSGKGSEQILLFFRNTSRCTGSLGLTEAVSEVVIERRYLPKRASLVGRWKWWRTCGASWLFLSMLEGEGTVRQSGSVNWEAWLLIHTSKSSGISPFLVARDTVRSPLSKLTELLLWENVKGSLRWRPPKSFWEANQ